jgi:hypothetical protein
MSRAFVNEDAGASGPRRDYHLPPRGDPKFDAAAATVMLEDATGYLWGEPKLATHVRRIMREAESRGDERLEQLARRFLR